MDKVDIELEKLFRVNDASELPDWNIPLSFMKPRHVEEIRGLAMDEELWRIKDRMKTNNVILSLCLNIGVDPPDVVKTEPCARLECWINPLAMSPSKANEQIGRKLQQQYERWQPRARYKQLLDPTLEDIKKLCITYRRTAKSDRLLFHYNGHGVPKPTVNGEIWVFNKSYTQYIPLSLYDLQGWMNFPSIYIFDCSMAGLVVDRFKQFARQREQEFLLQDACENSSEVNGSSSASSLGLLNHSIILASCGTEEMLPMNPQLPADLFTSCLTTPIQTSLKWITWKKVGRLVNKSTFDSVDQIPGTVSDRKTPMGELNWIFTAITDTIAWNLFPRELFKRLYRQDLLVASLFRNYLLAERIMHSYGCAPVTHPELLPTYQHPLWEAWDLAQDHCLNQLPAVLEGKPYKSNPFFKDQMKAFQVWLVTGSPDRRPPEQLPIILQVLLSQSHRFQALELLGRFLDLGPWAVNHALSVGIFPYVLKLLQSKNRELQPILVFIWAKILSVDRTCQTDLSKEGNYMYFLDILKDSNIQYEYRTMAAFVLAVTMEKNIKGQTACLHNQLIPTCLKQLNEPNPLLRRWLALCLGCLWDDYEEARWTGVKECAHDKLFKLLWDDIPEVRAAGVFALGKFVSTTSGEGNDHHVNINHTIGMQLLNLYQDPSPIVRKELVASLSQLVYRYCQQFQIASLQALDNLVLPSISTSITAQGWVKIDMDSSLVRTSSGGHRERAYCISNSNRKKEEEDESSSDDLQSSSEGVFDSLPTMGPGSSTYKKVASVDNFYTLIWKGVNVLSKDAVPEVSKLAGRVVQIIKELVQESSLPLPVTVGILSAQSVPSSPVRRSSASASLVNLVSRHQVQHSSTLPRTTLQTSSQSALPSQQLPPRRQLFDSTAMHNSDDEDDDDDDNVKLLDCAKTNFFSWCCKYFAFPIIKVQKTDDADPFGDSYFQREWRFARNDAIRHYTPQLASRAEKVRNNDQMFVNKISEKPQVLKFHPYQPLLSVASKTNISIWDIENGSEQCTFSNLNEQGKITSLEYINPHDVTYLMSGTDDGVVKVWRHCMTPNATPELVTAWTSLTDMLSTSKTAGLVLNWDQMNGVLHASGDVRVIRLWDTHKEMRIVDIPTGADSSVTCMTSDPSSYSVIVAGCGDGSVRVYDKRQKPTSCLVRKYQEHDSLVVSVNAQRYGNKMIISGCNNGDLRFWDLSKSQSVSCLKAVPAMYICESHPHVPLLACCGLNSQSIKIYNVSNNASLNPIQYHTGFMGQKIDKTKCLAFHPNRLWLAVSSNDMLLSSYTWEKRK